ncbi:hypothetical protein IE53DRAFT_368588 [Violaceomyces palustris]|uniref:Uncharacterized protein n=1 Tax=Violaceomyces palustris TaxID=1673888 RepID=A0ACD0NYC8_9BASI|nr:hypothetical protein IE53DRAFT_368588 [Violaceomyces palustris]
MDHDILGQHDAAKSGHVGSEQSRRQEAFFHIGNEGLMSLPLNGPATDPRQADPRLNQDSPQTRRPPPPPQTHAYHATNPNAAGGSPTLPYGVNSPQPLYRSQADPQPAREVQTHDQPSYRLVNHGHAITSDRRDSFARSPPNPRFQHERRPPFIPPGPSGRPLPFSLPLPPPPPPPSDSLFYPGGGRKYVRTATSPQATPPGDAFALNQPRLLANQDPQATSPTQWPSHVQLPKRGSLELYMPRTELPPARRASDQEISQHHAYGPVAGPSRLSHPSGLPAVDAHGNPGMFPDARMMMPVYPASMHNPQPQPPTLGPPTFDPSDPPRARVACTFCRARKLRCDGSNPCRHCERRSLDCVYAPTKAKAKHNQASGNAIATDSGAPPRAPTQASRKAKSGRNDGERSPRLPALLEAPVTTASIGRSVAPKHLLPSVLLASADPPHSQQAKRRSEHDPAFVRQASKRKGRETPPPSSEPSSSRHEEGPPKRRPRENEWNSLPSPPQMATWEGRATQRLASTSASASLVAGEGGRTDQELELFSLGGSSRSAGDGGFSAGSDLAMLQNADFSLPAQPAADFGNDWWDHLIHLLGRSRQFGTKLVHLLLKRFMQSNAVFFGLLHAPTLLDSISRPERRAASHPAVYFAVLAVAVIDMYRGPLSEPYTADMRAADQVSLELSNRFSTVAMDYINASMNAEDSSRVSIAQAASILALIQPDGSAAQDNLIRLVENVVRSLGLASVVSIMGLSPGRRTKVRLRSPEYYEKPPSRVNTETEVKFESLVRLAWTSTSHRTRRIISKPDESLNPAAVPTFVEELRPSAYWQPSTLPEDLPEVFFKAQDLLTKSAELAKLTFRIARLPASNDAASAPREAFDALTQLDGLEEAFQHHLPESEEDFGSILGMTLQMFCKLHVWSRVQLWRNNGIWRMSSSAAEPLAPTIELWLKLYGGLVAKLRSDLDSHVSSGTRMQMGYAEVDSAVRHTRVILEITKASNQPDRTISLIDSMLGTLKRILAWSKGQGRNDLVDEAMEARLKNVERMRAEHSVRRSYLELRSFQSEPSEQDDARRVKVEKDKGKGKSKEVIVSPPAWQPVNESPSSPSLASARSLQSNGSWIDGAVDEEERARRRASGRKRSADNRLAEQFVSGDCK